jgi:hypothetical protein
VVTSRSDILIKACVVMIYWLSLTRILMRSSISLDFISFSVAFLYSLAYLIFYDQKRALVYPHACGPVGGAWPGGPVGAGLPEALLPGRARWDAGGEEFALRVICMQDRDCSQWRKYI